MGKKKRGVNHNNHRAKKLVQHTVEDTDKLGTSTQPNLDLPPEIATTVASTQASGDAEGLPSYERPSEVHGEASCGIDQPLPPAGNPPDVTSTQEKGRGITQKYPSELPPPESFTVPSSLAAKAQRKSGSVSLQYPQSSYLLLAYSETTAEDVIRPCVVTKGDRGMYMQWFGFIRPKDDGLLRVFAYERISGAVPNLFQGKKLSQGISFSQNVVDNAKCGLRNDVFENEDVTNYAPYYLTPEQYGVDIIYVIRLICSVKLWKRIAERIWWRANRIDAIPAFEMFRLQREYWLQRTGNARVLQTKLRTALSVIMEILRESGLLNAVLEDMCLLDEEDNNRAHKIVEFEKRDKTLLGWVHKCGTYFLGTMVGSDLEGSTPFRWGYEDWARPRSILPGNPVHWGDVNGAEDQTSIQPANEDVHDNAIGTVLRGGGMVVLNRHSQNTIDKLGHGNSKLRDNLEKAVGLRMRIAISSPKCVVKASGSLIEVPKSVIEPSENVTEASEIIFEGTIVSVSDTNLAIQDLDSPPALRLISLDSISRWETRQWNHRNDYSEEESDDEDFNEEGSEDESSDDEDCEDKIPPLDDRKEWPTLQEADIKGDLEKKGGC